MAVSATLDALIGSAVQLASSFDLNDGPNLICCCLLPHYLRPSAAAAMWATSSTQPATTSAVASAALSATSLACTGSHQQPSWKADINLLQRPASAALSVTLSVSMSAAPCALSSAVTSSATSSAFIDCSTRRFLTKKNPRAVSGWRLPNQSCPLGECSARSARGAQGGSHR